MTTNFATTFIAFIFVTIFAEVITGRQMSQDYAHQNWDNDYYIYDDDDFLYDNDYYSMNQYKQSFANLKLQKKYEKLVSAYDEFMQSAHSAQDLLRKIPKKKSKRKIPLSSPKTVTKSIKKKTIAK